MFFLFSDRVSSYLHEGKTPNNYANLFQVARDANGQDNIFMLPDLIEKPVYAHSAAW